jgi:hypothetical protein
MDDLYTEQRQAHIKEWAEWVDSLEERRERALERLGDKYLLAPANRVKRRAKPYGER